MTWTRLNDGWTDSPEISTLSFTARWHYLSMIQWCSKNALYDGLIRAVDARRCSDVPDVAASLAELVATHRIVQDGDSYVVVDIDQHIPLEHLRSPETLARLAMMNAAQQANRGPNKLELAGYFILDSLKIPYERQVMFEGKFTPDALVPSALLVIQFDGEYWHDRAGTSTHTKIRKQVQLDRTQDAYIRKCGWEVIRFWESDIHHDPERCAQVVSTALIRQNGLPGQWGSPAR